MIRIIVRVTVAVLLVWGATEYFGDQLPWLVDNMGWIMAAAVGYALLGR